MFIRVGIQVPVEDLIKGMIVQSGNDACVALAEGDRRQRGNFAQMMNREAQRLGMNSSASATRPVCPTRSTTRRRATWRSLAGALIRDFPRITPSTTRSRNSATTTLPSQPQPPALARSDGRWRQDRPHRCRWFCLPDFVGQAGPAPPAVGRARCRLRQRPCAGVAEAAQLRLPVLRRRPALRQGSGRFQSEGLEGPRRRSRRLLTSDFILAVPKGFGPKGEGRSRLATAADRTDLGRPGGRHDEGQRRWQAVRRIPVVALETVPRLASSDAPSTRSPLVQGKTLRIRPRLPRRPYLPLNKRASRRSTVAFSSGMVATRSCRYLAPLPLGNTSSVCGKRWTASASPTRYAGRLDGTGRRIIAAALRRPVGTSR